MRLKSYLRGIGIGVLVTAAVFVISGTTNKKNAMTDEQIKERAAELGMIEASATLAQTTGYDTGDAVLTVEVDEKKTEPKNEEAVQSTEVKPEDKTEETKAEVKPEDKKEETKSEVKTETKTEETKAEVKPENKKEETKTEAKTEENVNDSGEDSKEVIIVVNKGDGSDTVSRKLYEAGIVADAREYDKYLMENGYDRTITAGNHRIKVTATKEEIAKNLTSAAR